MDNSHKNLSLFAPESASSSENRILMPNPLCRVTTECSICQGCCKFLPPESVYSYCRDCKLMQNPPFRSVEDVSTSNTHVITFPKSFSSTLAELESPNYITPCLATPECCKFPSPCHDCDSCKLKQTRLLQGVKRACDNICDVKSPKKSVSNCVELTSPIYPTLFRATTEYDVCQGCCKYLPGSYYSDCEDCKLIPHRPFRGVKYESDDVCVILTVPQLLQQPTPDTTLE